MTPLYYISPGDLLINVETISAAAASSGSGNKTPYVVSKCARQQQEIEAWRGVAKRVARSNDNQKMREILGKVVAEELDGVDNGVNK